MHFYKKDILMYLSNNVIHIFYVQYILCVYNTDIYNTNDV